LRAGLVRTKDDDLSMYAPGHIPEPNECFAAVQTVAVLLVDADDAPSTSHHWIPAIVASHSCDPAADTTGWSC